MAVMLLLAATGCQDWVAFMGGGGLTGNDSGETTISASNVGQLAPAFSLATPNNEIVIMNPVESGGVVYGGTANGHLFASTLNGNDASCSGTPKVCQPLWTASDGDGFVLSPAVSGGRVFAAFQSQTTGTPELAAFDAAGSTNCSGIPVVCQPLWSADDVSLFGPNVADGKVFITGLVPSLPSLQVQAYDAAGVQNCSGTPTVCQPLWTALGGKGTPAVSGGKVYTTAGNDIVAYDENGVTNCSGAPKVCQPLFSVHNVEAQARSTSATASATRRRRSWSPSMPTA